MTDAIFLAILGLVSGITGGLLGIGGSVILLPALAIAFAHRHPPEYQHIYQAAAMIMNFFVAFPATISHYKKQMILWPIVKWIIPAALAGILIGVACSNLPVFMGQGSIHLKHMLGAFLLYVLGYNLYRLIKRNKLQDITNEQALKISPLRSMLVVGFPMGYLAGLLGIGGGALCVPLQQVFLKMPLPRAIANSATTIMCISIFGAIYKNITIPASIGGVTASLKLASLVVPTSIIGGYLGAKLTYLLPRNIVRIFFCCLMLYAGIKLILS